MIKINFHTFFYFFSFLLISISLISLFTYNPTDESWFYFDSNSNHISNLFGPIGSNVSALFIYLFGLSSFIIIFFLIYILVNIIYKVSFLAELERFFGFLLLILTVATLCAKNNIQFYNGGGIFGDFLLKKSLIFFDKNIIGIIIGNLFLISLILISRFYLVSTLSKTILTLGSFKKYKFDHPIFIKLKNIFYHPFLKSWNYIHINLVGENDSNFQETLFKIEYLDLQNSAINIEEKIENINLNNEDVIHVTPNIDDFKTPYDLPDLKIFSETNIVQDNKKINKEIENQARVLEEKLKCFGIFGTVTSIQMGPVVSLFEYEPQIDSKISKIIALEDDLAMALETTSIRIIAPIPGKSVVGFEVANKNRKDVLFAQITNSTQYQNFKGYLPLVLGQDTIGNKIVVDLVKMPHLLIAGSTGSGKSVALNTMLISLLCKLSPIELKFILIDPKRLEFAAYSDIAHLLFPIITLPKNAIAVLKWLIKEMENRYEQMSQVGAKNIFDYNNLVESLNKEKIPFIVLMIDELADLIMTSGKEVEDAIIRIAQMARASGIHMIVATQRPSVDVITGLIKVNFPSRISFKVASKIDSRTILDCTGADKLLGKGDMLFLDSYSTHPNRIHGAYVSNDEIFKVVNHIKNQLQVKYLNLSEEFSNSKNELSGQDDLLYNEIIDFIKNIDEVSISLIQRKFRIGYNRSARLIEMLEMQGYILPSEGGKSRKVIKNNS